MEGLSFLLSLILRAKFWHYCCLLFSAIWSHNFCSNISHFKFVYGLTCSFFSSFLTLGIWVIEFRMLLFLNKDLHSYKIPFRQCFCCAAKCFSTLWFCFYHTKVYTCFSLLLLCWCCVTQECVVKFLYIHEFQTCFCDSLRIPCHYMISIH